ncbi:hypothetical protein AvCA_37980 [Azotobacter vinelandii CA]|uniref:Uncharacterized protein n=2 Tax=Azotobacter vinelandii TaxID=354 RepID=C1DS67_AZOVD|nr:hypothetical protein [Azotobacter vinelandii]ACO79942.1 hypothetical protein Avin_37980 [Azotobacter vinelandii DJ]AGK14526.1 hypothetical protein AvCA_37980 [Azotobacter vinelandii CA]AGK21615.1 hypothetical protein AvCA6_37980 [Azotobacter vinelandii CA6]SFX45676.1 hypothetical protein SAMN04244547_01651 [Azotobacter vinelandii]GLK62252.1 hypothetical protein GCM10017624_44160 [Azotobacter vinelandii]
MSGKMNAIIWPEDCLPGTTEHFAANEIIVADPLAATHQARRQ